MNCLYILQDGADVGIERGESESEGEPETAGERGSSQLLQKCTHRSCVALPRAEDNDVDDSLHD
jgi:hypothetical protein